MSSRTTMTYAVALGLASALALAGCGSEDGPTTNPTGSSSSTGSATPSGSATPTPTGSASASIEIPAEARANTEDGAIAFVRFYFEQLNLAYTKPDTSLLPPLATSGCQSCVGLQDGVKEIDSAGQRMKSDLVAPIAAAEIASEAPAGQTWVKFTLTQMAVPVIDKSGKELEGQKASSVEKIVSVIREGDQWRVHAIADQA
ncbi:hypothetical protein N802_06720 [Knoellia sinensis KCTC 19936]|uniref:DUF6318 domain-containing protein n=1 Tax=Knoellia sinensis KCTC 19936 TaxID=1385520 RepID=A0A0A0J0E1_9MICO|nr:DUF6318 family protein [Knoellia sinensis]KGN30503.1 hypothetical protein N802_06720 [Knoellia sinensis KCTC 19936]